VQVDRIVELVQKQDPHSTLQMDLGV